MSNTVPGTTPKPHEATTQDDVVEMLASVCEKQERRDDAARWRAKLANNLAAPESARTPGQDAR